MQNTKNLLVAERARNVAVEVYRTTAAFPASELGTSPPTSQENAREFRLGETRCSP